MRWSLLLVVVLLGSTLAANISHAQPQTPEGRPTGLAARYPGDHGLGGDAAVLLFEDFDGVDLPAVTARWNDVSNKDNAVLSLSDDVPAAVSGEKRRSLQVTGHPDKDTGGHLYRKLPRGVDEVYLRFYVKFPSPPGYIHHFVHVGGYNPATNWPQGHAGERPQGDDRVSVGIEPFGRDGTQPPPGDWNFYAYWHEMKKSGDGRFWGNGLSPTVRQPAPVDRWQCVEVRLKLNTVGKRDGVLALWLDGKLAADIHQGVRRGPWTGLGFVLREANQEGEPFEGFDFRTSDKLKINFVQLMLYVTDTNQKRNKVDDLTRPIVVRFDQVVAATSYIGPIEPVSSP